MDAKYYITLDKVPPLFKPRRGSKKTQPEHDTRPKTMSETYFSCLALFCSSERRKLASPFFPPWQLIDWLVKLEETQGQSSQITDTDEGREPHINKQRTTERLAKKSEAPKKRQDRQSKTKPLPNEATLV